MQSNVKRTLKKITMLLPGNGWWIISSYRKLALVKRRALVKYRNLSHSSPLPDCETVFWIDPIRVKKHTNYIANGNETPFEDRVFSQEGDRGKIHGGNWDVSNYHFADLDIYKAIESRINGLCEWEDTTYYQLMIKSIKEGSAPWQCKSEEDLVNRCAYIDELIQSIKENGYKQNHTVKLESEDSDGLHSKDSILGDEVTVNIGRSGEYLFQDGRHRLAIAQVLGVKEIPVKVLVRHEKWVEFRRYLLSMAEGNGGASKDGSLYQIAIHPDLCDIPAWHGCEDRFDAIAKNLVSKTGTVLDVGANLGYFCHKLEDIGFNCYAVENSADIAYATDRIRSSEGKGFTVINGNLYDVSHKPPLKGKKMNVVLLLSVLHHSLKTKESFVQLEKWLEYLQTDEIFFEPHSSNDPQMQSAYKNFSESEFVDFVSIRTGLNQVVMIHTCHDGRNVYHLTRKSLGYKGSY